MPMSRDILTRATPDIAEPDMDRPKTDGARHNHLVSLGYRQKGASVKLSALLGR